jgi:hypothetical protein
MLPKVRPIAQGLRFFLMFASFAGQIVVHDRHGKVVHQAPLSMRGACKQIVWSYDGSVSLPRSRQYPHGKIPDCFPGLLNAPGLILRRFCQISAFSSSRFI